MSIAETTKKKTFYEEFSEKVIENLNAGTAPWQNTSKSEIVQMPFNPLSGKTYKGANKVWLCIAAREMETKDPRWLTLHQANQEGFRVKKGSKGTMIQYWQLEQKIKEIDDSGKPVLDDKGNQKYILERLEKPILRTAFVFNGTQIEGLEPWDNNMGINDWNEDRIGKVMESSKSLIFKNEIPLPAKGNFLESSKDYAAALHKLSNWTGHGSRLNSEIRTFGSESYLKEELRVEIASWMLASELGVPYEPKVNKNYKDSLVHILKESPFEIMRACKYAEQSMEYIMHLEREKVIDKNQETNKRLEEKVTEKVFLVVPYADKDLAKNAGAKWDSVAKSWYAPEGIDLVPLKAWLPSAKPPLAKDNTLDPRSEFARALKDYGLDLGGNLPEMDGKIHRVPIYGDKLGRRSGAYCGYTDGIPAGWVENYRTGEKAKWIATGHVITEEEKVYLKEQAHEKQQLRIKEQKRQQEVVASWCSKYYEARPMALSEHPYLVSKQIYSKEFIKETPDGSNLIVPLTNSDGEIRNLQYISDKGIKRFHPGGEKKGNFCLIGADIKRDEKKLASGEIILAEGLATGISIYNATDKPVAVAFDAGNLESVAIKLREKFPKAALTICADNDHNHVRENVGVSSAERAARKVSGKVIVPKFTKDELNKGITDFNDLYMSRGLKEVTSQIKRGLQLKSYLERDR